MYHNLNCRLNLFIWLVDFNISICYKIVNPLPFVTPLTGQYILEVTVALHGVRQLIIEFHWAAVRINMPAFSAVYFISKIIPGTQNSWGIELKFILPFCFILIHFFIYLFTFFLYFLLFQLFIFLLTHGSVFMYISHLYFSFIFHFSIYPSICLSSSSSVCFSFYRLWDAKPVSLISLGVLTNALWEWRSLGRWVRHSLYWTASHSWLP